MNEIALTTLSTLKREFAKNGLDSNRFSQSGLIPVRMLKEKGEYEVPGLKIGYGEKVFVSVYGEIKLGAGHSPSLASDRVQLARKVGSFTGAWVDAERDWQLISSPPDKEMQVMWRLVDDPHGDNEQVDFQFLYYIFNSLG